VSAVCVCVLCVWAIVLRVCGLCSCTVCLGDCVACLRFVYCVFVCCVFVAGVCVLCACLWLVSVYCVLCVRALCVVFVHCACVLGVVRILCVCLRLEFIKSATSLHSRIHLLIRISSGN